jgi:hypothetical protein
MRFEDKERNVMRRKANVSNFEVDGGCSGEPSALLYAFDFAGASLIT